MSFLHLVCFTYSECVSPDPHLVYCKLFQVSSYGGYLRYTIVVDNAPGGTNVIAFPPKCQIRSDFFEIETEDTVKLQSTFFQIEIATDEIAHWNPGNLSFVEIHDMVFDSSNFTFSSELNIKKYWEKLQSAPKGLNVTTALQDIKWPDLFKWKLFVDFIFYAKIVGAVVVFLIFAFVFWSCGCCSLAWKFCTCVSRGVVKETGHIIDSEQATYSDARYEFLTRRRQPKTQNTPHTKR